MRFDCLDQACGNGWWSSTNVFRVVRPRHITDLPSGLPPISHILGAGIPAGGPQNNDGVPRFREFKPSTSVTAITCHRELFGARLLTDVAFST